MTQFLKLTGATVYDPRNHKGGRQRDLWVSAGKIVSQPLDHQNVNVKEVDLAGLVIMPGGVDMHCHIAGGKVNKARLLTVGDRDATPPWWRQGEKKRSLGPVPSTVETGLRYAMLGYTSAFDAAVSPLHARQTHFELSDTPCIDSGFYCLLGNNVPLLKLIEAKDQGKIDQYLSWVLEATGGYAPKLVNPGGVENWKRYGTDVRSLDEKVGGIDTSPSEILSEVAASAGRLDLPHPVHVHCNQLGLPGNWQITAHSMRLLSGLKAHLTHIQFHSYDGSGAEESSFGSRVAELSEIVNQQPDLSVDVGQVMFGKTVSLTGDGPAAEFLSRLYGSRWVNFDTELESGCGIIPIEYKNRSKIHAWQWAIGLQWYLMVDNPWQVVMSTDHPNGGSFEAYPNIIRLLCDREFRRSQVEKLPTDIKEESGLLAMDREYSLEEIAVITRAGPAKLLGLKNKGHLGEGADADLTVYLPNSNLEEMFQMPKFVMKSGRWVVEDFELAETVKGQRLNVGFDFDPGRQAELDQWVNQEFGIPSFQYRI